MRARKKMALHNKMEFEGKDIAEAISKACKALKVPQENLDIEVLTTGTSGIFGLCKQKARLRVGVKKESRETGDAEPIKKPSKPKREKTKSEEKKLEKIAKEKTKTAKIQPAEKAESAATEAGDDLMVAEELQADVKTDLVKILELMNYPSEVSVTSDKENVTAQIKGQHVNEIIEQNGKLLDSLQYLLRKIIGKKYSEKAIISLDAGDFRAARTEELKQLGLQLAAEVKKSGKTRSIPSLNPSERRVVHVALQDDKEVRSRSVGEGLFKKVLIYCPGSKGKKGSPKRRKGSRNKKQIKP
jgi:spoIIIJ-associated protein